MIRSKSPFFHRRWNRWVGFFHDQTYHFTVHLVWNLNHEQLKRYVSQQFDDNEPDNNDNWAGRCAEYATREHEVQMIAIRKWRGTAFDHSVLVHECVHAAHNVLGSRGFKLTDESVEAYCYLIDSIYHRCLEQIIKAKGTKK